MMIQVDFSEDTFTNASILMKSRKSLVSDRLEIENEIEYLYES